MPRRRRYRKMERGRFEKNGQSCYDFNETSSSGAVSILDPEQLRRFEPVMTVFESRELLLGNKGAAKPSSMPLE